MDSNDLVWQCKQPNEPNPYQLEWDHLMQAIREDKPYNEAAAAPSQPGHVDGPHGLPHRPGRDLRRDLDTITSSPRTSTS